MASSNAVVPLLVSMMLLTGVCNTLLTKYQDMQCITDCETPHPKLFEQPVIQTLQMFIGESGCWLVVLISFLLRRFNLSKSLKESADGDIQYQRVETDDSPTDTAQTEDETAGLSSSQTLVDPTNVVAKPLIDGNALGAERRPLKGLKVFLLALPAMCDICGTTLMNVGLLHVAASIYQMVRGALVLFVGLFSVLFLKRRLGGWKWASLFIVVLGVAVVGLAGAIEQGASTDDPPAGTQPKARADLFRRALVVIREAVTTADATSAAETIFGVFMIAGAQIFTASQFVVEESIMEQYSMDPIEVVGWEGVFGFAVTLLGMGVMHVLNGEGYFDASEAFREVFTNPTIAVTSVLIMISIGGFNFFGLSVTRVISATSRSTIDTCRTLFIWIVSLGLGWETFKWLQVLGFALLVYGTAIFNELVQPPRPRFLQNRRRNQPRASGEHG